MLESLFDKNTALKVCNFIKRRLQHRCFPRYFGRCQTSMMESSHENNLRKKCPCFSAFRLNTERYGVSVGIQSECGKMRTRITSNADTFHAVNS